MTNDNTKEGHSAMEGILLSRELILEADDYTIERVDCPEWGGSVYVRSMSGTERDLFEQSMLDKKGERKDRVENIRAALAARTVCDATGQRLFSDKDIQHLGSKSGKALDRIFGVSQRLSGLSQKDIEELAKNSDAGPSEDTTST
jgi:hypothetical protein